MIDKSITVTDLDIGVKSLFVLSAPSTPTAVRDEVIERAENGEHLSAAQIKDLVDKAAADARAELEAQLASARAEAFQRETEIRAEYEGSAQGKIDKSVEKATAPLHRKIEQYEAKLAKIKERDEARRAKQPKKKDDTSEIVPQDDTSAPVIQPNIASILMAKTEIEECLAGLCREIDAGLLVEDLVAAAMSIDDLGDLPQKAAAVSAWLTRFVAAAAAADDGDNEVRTLQ